jgi:hypothetical protein
MKLLELAKYVSKSLNILIQYNLTNTVEAGTDILSSTNIPFLLYDFLKDGIIVKTDGVLTTKNKMDRYINFYFFLDSLKRSFCNNTVIFIRF